jgi:hypothetical protein
MGAIERGRGDFEMTEHQSEAQLRETAPSAPSPLPQTI